MYDQTLWQILNYTKEMRKYIQEYNNLSKELISFGGAPQDTRNSTLTISNHASYIYIFSMFHYDI